MRGAGELFRCGAAHGGEYVVDGFPEFYFISFPKLSAYQAFVFSGFSEKNKIPPMPVTLGALSDDSSACFFSVFMMCDLDRR